MSHLALIVIDMQRGLVAAAWQPKRLLAVHRQLLTWAQAEGIPIIAMQHDGAPGSLVPTGSEAWQLQPDLLPDAATVIRKTASDSFYETELAERLAQLGIEQLVLTGIKSERCVDTTARAAVSRGFKVALVADGHSTLDSPVLDAEGIVAFTNFNLQGFGNARASITVLPAAGLIVSTRQAQEPRL